MAAAVGMSCLRHLAGTRPQAALAQRLQGVERPEVQGEAARRGGAVCGSARANSRWMRRPALPSWAAYPDARLPHGTTTLSQR